MGKFPSREALSLPGGARILCALVLVLAAPALSAETDPYVGDMEKICAQATEHLSSSEIGEAEWSAWLVSGGKAGTSRRFPENTDPYVPPKVTVEHLKAGSFQAMSLTGVRPDGQSWMVWFDTEHEGCVLLTGSPESMSGDEASLQATNATERVFKRGDLELVLTLDDRHRAEDTTKHADGWSPCKKGDQCQSALCVGSVCRKANGEPCEADTECASNQCVGVCEPKP